MPEDELDLEDVEEEDFLSKLQGEEKMVTKKKKVAVEEEVVEGVVFDDFVINSPNRVESVGAVQLTKHGPVSVSEAMSYTLAAQELFDQMWAFVADNEPAPSPAAISLAKSRVREAGEDVDEYAWSEMTPADITELINEMTPETKPAPKKRTSGRRPAKRSRGGGGKSYKLANPDGPATSKQMDLVAKLAEQNDVDYDEDMTKKEASDFIQEYM